MYPRIIKLFLILFIFTDLIIAFLQYGNIPIDGDLYAIVLPAPWYAEVLADPFGLEALTESKEYGGAGRYSAHWLMSTYFKSIPFLFQWFVDPIRSIYYSSAFIKILAHIGLVGITAAFICGHLKLYKRDFLMAAAAVIPFIHTYGLYNRMGLIDRSVTYVFFYILPFLLLLVLLYPLYKYAVHYREKPFTLGWFTIPWLVLAFCLAFFGPMSQSLMMLSGGLILLYIGVNDFSQNKDWMSAVISPIRGRNKTIGVLAVCFIVFGAFGYLVGMQNVENISSLPLSEAIPKALKGISFHFLETWHFWLMMAFLGVHFGKLWNKKSLRIRRYKHLFIYLGVAMIIYLLSLPLGGYRSYRPMIYRYDLLIPVTWSMIYILLKSGKLMLDKQRLSGLKIYLPAALIFLAVLWSIDLSVRMPINVK